MSIKQHVIEALEIIRNVDAAVQAGEITAEQGEDIKRQTLDHVAQAASEKIRQAGGFFKVGVG